MEFTDPFFVDAPLPVSRLAEGFAIIGGQLLEEAGIRLGSRMACVVKAEIAVDPPQSGA